MADARQKSEWGQTSSIISMIANVNRDPSKHPAPYKPMDFSPFKVNIKNKGTFEDVGNMIGLKKKSAANIERESRWKAIREEELRRRSQF